MEPRTGIMAQYHFRLVDRDVLRKLVVADLENLEEVKDRAELLANLILMTEFDWFTDGDDVREILVTDEDGHEVLVLPFSEIRQNRLDN